MKRFFKIIFYINIFVVILTFLGLAALLVSPEHLAFLHQIGLFMPWLLLFNFVFFLFWIFSRKWHLFLSLICLLISLSASKSFIGFHFNQTDIDHSLGIISFNCNNFNLSNNIQNFVRSWDQLSQYSVFCVQELTEDLIPEVKKNTLYNYHVSHKAKVIFSKTPIIDQGFMQFDNSVNGCVWADISFENRKFRIYNLHLRSNNITRSTEQLIHNIDLNERSTWDEIRSVFLKYGKASVVRIRQMEQILDHMNASPFPVVICGDFNETPLSYFYQMIDRKMIDAFKMKGLGIGTTYAGSLPGLKIDYIFVDENFEVQTHQIIREKHSDHFPVLSRLKLKY